MSDLPNITVERLEPKRFQVCGEELRVNHGVRITDNASGLFAESTEHRSFHQNRRAAMEALRELVEHE